MKHATLAGTDLNLLYALVLLTRERSVSRVAKQLGITQSAMSHRLRRLREQFDDPLLVAAGRTLVPTTRAEALAAELVPLFERMADTVVPLTPFEPHRSERTFVVSTSDYGEFVGLPNALERMREQAPNVRVRFVPPRPDLASQLERGTVDLAVGPRVPTSAGLVQRKLDGEPFVVVVREGHPKVRRKPRLATYLAAEHLAVSPRGTPGTFVDDVLDRLGHERRVVLTVGHFSTAPFIVGRTDLIWTAPREVAEEAQQYVPLCVYTPPFDLPQFAPFITWHERQHKNPGHIWLRQMVVGLQT